MREIQIMKVIVKSVIDNLTGAVEYIETEEYDGPVALCKTGAGSAGARAGRAFVRARGTGGRTAVTQGAFRQARRLGARAQARFVASANRVINRAGRGRAARNAANRAADVRRARARGGRRR
jgi:hypothetical protein